MAFQSGTKDAQIKSLESSNAILKKARWEQRKIYQKVLDSLFGMTENEDDIITSGCASVGEQKIHQIRYDALIDVINGAGLMPAYLSWCRWKGK